MSIPLHLILTKPKQNKYENIYYICTDLDDCYNKIIIAIKTLILLSVDYPDDYEEFKNMIWFNTISFDNDIFDYSLFNEGNWVKPWSHQEIYDEVCSIIHNIDLQNSIFNKRNTYDYISESDSDKES